MANLVPEGVQEIRGIFSTLILFSKVRSYHGTAFFQRSDFFKHARKMGCSLSGDETLKYFEFLSPEESWDFFRDTGDYYSNTKDFFHSIVQKLVDYELPEHLKFFLHKAGDNVKWFDYFEYKEYRTDKKILFLLQNSPLSIQEKVLELAPKYKKYHSQFS